MYHSIPAGREGWTWGDELGGRYNNPGERCASLIAGDVVRHVRFWIYFSVKPPGYAGGLEVGTERKRGVWGDSKILD